MEQKTEPQTKAPFIAAGQLAVRFNTAEAEDVNELLNKLREHGKIIDSMKSAFWAIVDRCKEINENTPDASLTNANLQLITSQKEKIELLEQEMQKYSSIDITTLETDNASLRSENAELIKEIEILKNKIETIRTEGADFDSSHVSIRRDDPALVDFFRGADIRIKQQIPNVNGRITTRVEDVIEDLTILARSAAKKNLLAKKEGFNG